MSRVITFSRNFPATHPKAGKPTNFVFKIWNSLGNTSPALMPYAEAYFKQFPWNQSHHEFMADMAPKHHTVRGGKRWKSGDKFSPRVWSDKPYASKQIAIAPDITIERIFDIEMRLEKIEGLDTKHPVTLIDGKTLVGDGNLLLAENDGLTNADFVDWFQPGGKFKPFSGQILCWNAGVDYSSHTNA